MLNFRVRIKFPIKKATKWQPFHLNNLKYMTLRQLFLFIRQLENETFLFIFFTNSVIITVEEEKNKQVFAQFSIQ